MMWTNRRRPRRAAALIAATSMLGAGLVATTVAPATAQLGATEILADFEGPGVPAEWFVYQGSSSTITTTPIDVADSDPLARPSQSGDNAILKAEFNVTNYGGFGTSFEGAGPQDWSNHRSFDFWFKGTGSGRTFLVEVSDNRSDASTDTSERFNAPFDDTSTDWRYVSIPFADFSRSTGYQPGGAPDDGFTLTEIWAWAIPLPVHADTVYVDDVALGLRVVDDFESPLPSGTDPNGVSTGFYTFSGAGSTIAIDRTATPPTPALPAMGGQPNSALAMDVNSTSYAGYIHGFSEADGAWVSQDWTGYAGVRMWLYGNNSGTDMFVDLLESRNPGSTKDDAERWTTAFVDEFSGWKLLEFPFSKMTRKEIPNGAPNDGLTLETVFGYAIGVLGTGGPRRYYVDNVALYGVGEVPPLTVSFAVSNPRIEEGTTGEVVVKLNRALGADDPDQVSVDYATEEKASIAIAGREYTPGSGTLTFVKGGPKEQSFSIATFDDTKWEGDERIVTRLTGFVDVAPGGPSPTTVQGSVFIADDDKYDKRLIDDFERGAYLWSADPEASITASDVSKGDPLARPEQDDIEAVMEVATPLVVDFDVMGSTCKTAKAVIPVHLLSTPVFDATDVDHTTVRFGDAAEAHTSGKNKVPTRHVADVNGDGLQDLVFHFRANQTGYDCDSNDLSLTGTMKDGRKIVAQGDPVAFGRDFSIGQDWSKGAGLSFWYYGTGSGDDVTVTLKDNRATDPGPSGWKQVWSDEFDDPKGTPPNPENWNFEIGDVTPDGKNGWGNEELEYYTDDPANAATDGAGNLALTLREADGSQECYYGPCQYTSARLTSWNKAEFAYGRIESKIKVPSGDGIWPAFWSLGTDIDVVSWPQTGEIDFMEYVGREPDQIFGTIHGPGYAGGASFGGTETITDVAEDYHTYAVEWAPNEIRWYVDGDLFHEAAPTDVAPNEWVFNDPVFLLLNVAVGGNFGGPVGDNLTPPSSMLVDYVRVFQGPDTAERWETSFADTVAGWQRVTVPFDGLTRSADQPAGAPDDGLGLKEVWGYGFELPNGGTASGKAAVDLVTLDRKPKPAVVTVTNLDDSGDGSLRQALEEVAEGGTILFDPVLDGTIALNGSLAPTYDVVVDASDAARVALDGGGSDRVLVVPAGVEVTVKGLTITNGYGFQLAGGVLNNGVLTLDHVTVTGNTMTTNASDFWQGGGGIYNGDGASLTLVDSTVSGNDAGWSGGGIYSFFDTTTTVVRSTISGNTTSDVGGGLRTLGTVTIDNSTISGNTAKGWHGGAIFQTDGDVTIANSTIASNVGPDWAPSALFIGQFGGSFVPTLTLTNSIVLGNHWYACEKFASGTTGKVISGGHNLLQDDSCNPVASDQIVADAALGPLADNGGPTFTHALPPGSPAIDAADGTSAPATDQRGVTRPQGASSDVGSFEYVAGG